MRLPDRAGRGSPRLRRVCVAALIALATGSCSEPTAPIDPPPPEPVVTAIQEATVSMAAVGEVRQLVASVKRGSSTVTSAVTWWSKVDSIVRVSLEGTAKARRKGQTVLYAAADSGGIDSVTVTVDPVVTSIRFKGAPATMIQARARQFTVVGLDSAGVETGEPKDVGFGVADTMVATASNDGTVTAGAEGTTWIRATLGGLRDSTMLTVTPLPLLRFGEDTILLAAGAKRLLGTPVFADSVPPESKIAVTVTVDDPDLAWATPSIQVPRLADSDPLLTLHGLAVGTTRLRLSAPGWVDTEAVLVVREPRLGGFPRTERSVALWQGSGMSSYPADTTGELVEMLAPHWVRFTSLDTTFLTVVNDSSLIVGTSSALTPFTLKRNGTGEVVAAADGFRPETLSLRVTDGFFYHGAGMSDLPIRIDLGHVATVPIGSTGYCVCSGTSVAVQLSQTDPSVLRLPSTSAELSPLSPLDTIALEAIGLGVDTVFVSAPGHDPDTIVVTVERGAITVYDAPAAVSFTGVVSLHALLPSGDQLRGIPTTVRITSSDPSVLASADEFVTVPAGSWSFGVPLELRTTGAAILTLTDTSGFYLPHVLAPIEVRRATLDLGVATGAGVEPFAMGVRQRMGLGLHTPSALRGGVGGRIWSSDTAVIRLSLDSFPTLPIALTATSGSAPGTAWIHRSGNGFIPDSTPVTVTPARVAIHTGGNVTASPLGTEVVVSVRDASGNLRATDDTLFLKVRSTDRNKMVVLDSAVVILPGQQTSVPLRVTTTQLGSVALVVVSERSLPPFVETGATYFQLVDPLGGGVESPGPASTRSGTRSRGGGSPRR